MNCSKCKNIGEPYMDTALCQGCFCAMIEKRLRKRIRVEKLFTSGMVLNCKDDLIYNLVKKFVNNPRITISRVSGTPVLPWTMDHESLIFIKGLIDGEMKKSEKECAIKLLLPITDWEAQRYAKYKNLPYTPTVDSKEKALIDEICLNYPHAKHMLGKSVIELNRVFADKKN